MGSANSKSRSANRNILASFSQRPGSDGTNPKQTLTSLV